MSPSPNRTGNALEVVINCLLRCYGYGFADQYRTGILDSMQAEIIVDFFVYAARGFEDGLYIECKWQMTSGSADQKLYAILDRRQYYDRKTIVVADGSKLERGREMLSEHVGGKLYAVMTVMEFMEFIAKLDTARCPRLLLNGYDPLQKRLWQP